MGGVFHERDTIRGIGRWCFSHTSDARIVISFLLFVVCEQRITLSAWSRGFEYSDAIIIPCKDSENNLLDRAKNLRNEIDKILRNAL